MYVDIYVDTLNVVKDHIVRKVGQAVSYKDIAEAALAVCQRFPSLDGLRYILLDFSHTIRLDLVYNQLIRLAEFNSELDGEF